VIAPGSVLEERWIFGRAGGDGYAAGDLALTSSLAGMAARNAGAPARSLLIGPGKLSDRDGTRELLSSTSAKMIEADLQGATLAVTGDGISDFRAYAPDTTAVRINGQAASATLLDGVVIYPALPPAPAPDAGTPDAGIPDAGTPDAGPPDAGTPDAGTPDAGTPDAGTPDAGAPPGDGGTFIDGGTPGPIDAGPGNLQPDAGIAPPPDAGAGPDAGVGPPPTLRTSLPPGGWGCATGGGAALGAELAALFGLALLRRRRPGR
jgi:hypothetical protein